MTALQEIEAAVSARYLAVLGMLHPAPDDAGAGVGTLLLLGPRQPGFWAHFTATSEYRDGGPDPLDRWSARVIGALAADLGASALFPFGGPPHQPFLRWARESGRAHVSPVGMLVHDAAGLMVSYRGALGVAARFDLPPPPANPCLSCAEEPCRGACPVNALGADGYDIAACKADLDRPGNDCMNRGCAARRACPVSRAHARPEAQSAFHMAAFR